MSGLPRPQRCGLYSFVLLIIVTGISTAAMLQTTVAAEQAGQFVNRVYSDEAGKHPYVVFVPRGYTPDKKWPVILFLHGAGERGTDAQKPLTVGLGPYVKQQANSFPAIVVFPQCEDLKGPILSGWSAQSPDGRRALQILKDVERNYSVDQHRRILTGWSMGGYGVWSLAAEMPQHWSAIVPISGGGDVAAAAKLKDVPIWAIHGTNDDVVLADESRKMVDAVKAAGGNARYSAVSGAGHDVWKYAYANDSLYRWMLDPAGNVSAQVELRTKPGERAPLEAAENEPFIPAVELQEAVFVRLGNDVLKTIAESVPKNIPADVLSGGIRDIYDSTTTQGYFFNVHFSRIGYTTQVERAIVRAYAKDRLNVQIGLRNLNLTIGSTYVSGESHSAVAGPISIVVGHRRPVWLNLAFEPYVKDRQLHVRHVGTWFNIPTDNWYVSGPAGVSTRGFGMTREDVSGGLVSGIYGKKYRIEQEISAVVPRLVAHIEASLNRSDLNKTVSAFWPLPVYHPRLRVWPESVSTDANGISLTMGMTAAAVDAKRAPAKPLIFNANATAPADISSSTGLIVALAPNILEPLTQLLIDSDVARIHVGDIPQKGFALLGDRQALNEAIPELASLPPSAELWSELILVSPISILDSPASETTPDESDKSTPVVALKTNGTDATGDATSAKADDGDKSSATPAAGGAQQRALRISAPHVVVALAYRPEPGTGDWLPLAEFEFSVGQEATANLDRPTFRERELRLAWSGEPAIECTARFATGYQAKDPHIDVDKIRQLFVNAWREWTDAGSLARAKIDDIDFGLSKLRLNEVKWTGEDLVLGFSSPGIRISNSSDVDLVYETRGPYTNWGGPYTLPPGKSHDYQVSYPLTYRRKVDGSYSMFLLPAGSHVDFRRSAAGKEPSLVQLLGPAAAK